MSKVDGNGLKCDGDRTACVVRANGRSDTKAHRKNATYNANAPFQLIVRVHQHAFRELVSMERNPLRVRFGRDAATGGSLGT